MKVSTTQANQLFDAAYREFGCSEDIRTGRKNAKRNERKRDQIRQTGEQVIQEWNSDNPPQTQDEMISRVVSVVTRVLAYLFPQWAVAINVISVVIWFWQQLQTQNVSL